ncbi:MAG: hypothetical protein EF812_02485 [Methanosarcinales archaeon]|nr:MAG: hypothetical protein EF812_02485 [Methanosarcinales archaeon]
MRKDTGKGVILAMLLCIVILSSAVPVIAATTEVNIIKYASDDTTILNETTVTYQWMEANLAVQGDGVNYSHQGPIFEGDCWDPTEIMNIKDKGHVKGTDVKDLCELVGGMSTGDEVKIIASDGFSKYFGYENVYSPQQGQGPMVLCWYKDGAHVPDYSDGIQLVFFANDTVFGNWDMHECMAPEYRYNYSGTYPSSNGLSVRDVSNVAIYSTIDAVFDGEVTLTEGNFTLTAYDSGVDYEVKQLTPLGALDAAATAGGFDYNVTDKKFADKGILMVDDIGEYRYNKANDTVTWAWSCSVNGNVLDDWNNPSTEGLNVYELQDNDVVYYFYGNVKLLDYGAEDAIAVINITANAGTGIDVIFDGSVVLEEGNFVWHDTDGNPHEVANFTPHGALEVAADDGAFGYNGSWKDSKNTALIDWIEEYEYNDSVTPKLTWNYLLNGVYQDYYSDTTGVSNNPITDGDYIEFYYGTDQETTENATAVIRITVNPAIGDWNLKIVGAINEMMNKTVFEDGMACHNASYTDAENRTWEGIPLWYLVGRVDDKLQHGASAFNNTLAAEGYSVKVIAGDGWSTSLDVADIARNNGYIVANKLNGSALPENTSSGKPCWPLHLKGADVTGGQHVGNIVEIQLVGLPKPPEGWTLKLLGDVGDTITQAEFEGAVSCYHNVTYTDGSDIWRGVPLWCLCSAVDNLEAGSHWTFNDSLAATNYTVKVIAADGYNRSFNSSEIARNNGYIVANSLNGSPLDYLHPLKLVGSSVTSGTDKVGNISEINLVELITPSPDSGSYNLNLSGKITDVLSQAEYEAASELSCHGVTWTDSDTGDIWGGVPLWFFCGWTDDRISHGSDCFNDEQAAAGYKIIVKAGDGYSKEFASADVARNSGYIVADTLNGTPLSKEGSSPPWPLRLVGSEVSGGNRVGNIAEIELTEFGASTEVPSVHIIKYDTDGITILNETNVTYLWMKANLSVIGDGTTHYKFEACDFTGDHWGQNETYPSGFKIDRVVKGTLVKDLCELVGGMVEGTEIKLVSSDGYETKLGYENIYTGELSTEQQERQGEAFLAWWVDDQGYVPNYSNGMRLFFTANASDHIFGNWDMHECMDEDYWHYYWSDDIQYPSCGGLSTKYINTIKIYNGTEADWTLTLDGAIKGTISKSYFENALTCTMGEHASEYTDSKSRTWGGLPLWLLCGWVDDENSHSDGAYNDTLAAAGYNITIIASDGHSVTIDSRDTIRNSNYIVANTLNSTHIHEDSSNWPLRLIGANVSSAITVKRIVVYSNRTMLRGDANHDGGLTTVDSALALQMTVGGIETDLVADMSGDGRVTSVDALMILQATHDSG